MSTRAEMAKLLIEKIQEGQGSLYQMMQHALQENLDMPPGVQVFWVLNVALLNPEKVNWQILLGNVESLLRDSSEGELHELVFQEVLETFSNSITNGLFAHTWIASHLGPLSREYILKYDQLMKSRTPGF